MKTKKLPLIKRLNSIDFYSIVLLWIWIAGIVISFLIFLYLLFFQTSEYSFNISVEGFSGFLTIFEFPIKLLTASVVLFGLWLTIKRMEQTDKQIESISSNNRFNNFYKHREDFLKRFENFNFLKKINQYQQLHNNNRGIAPEKKVTINLTPYNLASEFYSVFYYSHPSDFNYEMNEISKQNIDKFIEKISKLSMKDTYEIDLNSISNEYLGGILYHLPGVVTRLTSTLARLDNIEIEHSDKNADDIRFFTKLNILYWAAIIINDLLVYENKTSESVINYIRNYNAVRLEKGLFN